MHTETKETSEFWKKLAKYSFVITRVKVQINIKALNFGTM
jgi:hypothetical protein